MNNEFYTLNELTELLSTPEDKISELSFVPSAEAIKQMLDIKVEFHDEAGTVKLYKAYRDFILNFIENHVESIVLNNIRERQKKIPNLVQDKSKMLAYWGGELTPGCKYCLNGETSAFRSSIKCNLYCKFCYCYCVDVAKFNEIPIYNKNIYRIGNFYFNLQSLESALIQHHKEKTKALGWVYYEPMCEENKLYPAMEIIAENGYYQFLYTNGTKLTEDNLKKLHDSGLNEIRFNLAATNCADNVVEKMAIARKYFDYVCIESPIFTEYYEIFKKKIDKILNTGVTHIHFAELQLTRPMIKYRTWDSEGAIYRHYMSYISPIKSRQLVYDIFDLAVSQNWHDVTLHDCSNEVKLYRGINVNNNLHNIAYQGMATLPLSFYVDAIQRYDIISKMKKLLVG